MGISLATYALIYFIYDQVLYIFTEFVKIFLNGNFNLWDIMIQANNVCLSFGEQIVFDNISFTLNPHDRIGLVGRNGSGKSTLLKAIAFQQHLDEGSISISSRKVVAYMPQEVVLESDKNVIDETLHAHTQLQKLLREIAAIEKQLANHEPNIDLDHYTHLQAELAELNPARIKAEAVRILTGLGFNEDHMEKPVSALSVGWKMRIVLAQLLLKKADFYLFDEPTNHLDIVAKDWFLDFLKSSDFGFLLVSHEKYFLDMLCTEILELELGKATFYSGNYSKYVVQKQHNLDLLLAAQVQQQKEIKQKKATIDRFRASASKARQAQSMIKAIEKIELITLPPSPKTLNFTFPPIQQPGRIVLEGKNIAQKFGARTIFDNANFEVERGEKVAVVAPNGVGKTTLFNLIIGQLPLEHGTITYGYNVFPTIFAQDQTKSLDGNKTIYENVLERCPKKTESQIRSFLGSFLFSNDDVHKKVKVLSGGEKNRVGMVCVLLQDANLLLLDEPTNHLDIPSKEMLLSALKAYKGTMLFVSHDHDFINHLATRIIELTPHGTHSYIGNYESYLYQKKVQQAANMTDEERQKIETQEQIKNEPKVKKVNAYDLTKQSKKLESKISNAEREIAKQELHFATLLYGTPDFKQAQEKLTKLKADLEYFMKEWESIQEQLTAN